MWRRWCCLEIAVGQLFELPVESIRAAVQHPGRHQIRPSSVFCRNRQSSSFHLNRRHLEYHANPPSNENGFKTYPFTAAM